MKLLIKFLEEVDKVGGLDNFINNTVTCIEADLMNERANVPLTATASSSLQ